MTIHRFHGKRVLITGGTSGIGLECAIALREEGAEVVVTGRNATKLSEAESNHGLVAIECDQSDPEEIYALKRQLSGHFGAIDILFANAGVAPFAHVTDMSLGQIDQVLNINVRGTFLMVRELMGMVCDGGSIVLNSSAIAEKGVPGYTLYSASKAAIRALARSFAATLSKRKIRVNTISPGPIHNEAFLEQEIAPEDREWLYSTILGRVPLGREGTLLEVVNAVLFLASEHSSYMTGADLQIDGGLSQI